MIFLISIIFFILSGNHIQAQNNKKEQTTLIEATVLDRDTKNPLPFTNVIIEGTSLGTISNEEGKFELTVSKNNLSGMILFSFVGYLDTRLPLKEFKNSEKIVYLKTASTPLDEVIVKAKNKYKELIDEAITLFPQNYAQEPVYLNSYYRELTKIDNTYTKFSDAACSIFYSPYNGSFDSLFSMKNYMQFNPLESSIKKVPFPEPQDFIASMQDQAKILAVRKSNNLQNYKIMEQSKTLEAIDTTDLKWLENNEIGGGPLRLTGADKVKRQADFLDPQRNSQYLYTLSGRSMYNNQPVYIISFAPKDSTYTKAIYQGKLTLD
ncbi:carboxypeptidase-like regulatory domain-containing protein [Aquimarina addita]